MSTILALTFLVSLLLTPAVGAYKIRHKPAGYIDNHLHPFRLHVNNVRAAKCLPRYRLGLAADELPIVGSKFRKQIRVQWKRRHWRAADASSSCTPWYITKQIWAGNILGRESAGDPWPNCPDPWDGTGSWTDTVGCENSGSWLDSPGFYRCGLQFHPNWELRFGRLCP